MLNLLRNKTVVLVAALSFMAIFAMGCTGGNNNFEEMPPANTDPIDGF